MSLAELSLLGSWPCPAHQPCSSPAQLAVVSTAARIRTASSLHLAFLPGVSLSSCQVYTVMLSCLAVPVLPATLPPVPSLPPDPAAVPQNRACHSSRAQTPTLPLHAHPVHASSAVVQE